MVQHVLVDMKDIEDQGFLTASIYFYLSGFFFYLVVSLIGDFIGGLIQTTFAIPMNDMFNAPYISTRYAMS
jgi:uncharacterized membrane protein YeaQ/YmgE (transglycosylase-associated protein family)